MEAPAPKKRPFFRRHPRKTRWGIALLLILTTFGIGELILRAKGFRPGYLHTGTGPFTPLTHGQDIQPSQAFFTDSTAIFRAQPDSFNNQPGYYINRHGFRSPEWETIDTTRPRLLLIGDSFLWGATAKPIDSAFADHIARAGYTTINLGIPGADPDQYLLLAQRYIPQFQPDAVLLFFYMGNDAIWERRKLQPYKNRYFVTQTLGWLNPYMDHRAHLGDLNTTYQYYLQRFAIPRTHWINSLAAQTCITTLLWQAKYHYIGGQHRWAPALKDSIEQSIALFNADSGALSAEYLHQISAIAQTHTIPIYFFLIPLHTNIEQPLAKHPRLAQSITWHTPPDLQTSDYHPWPDGHFTTATHRKYADFVLSTLLQLGLPPHNPEP